MKLNSSLLMTDSDSLESLLPLMNPSFQGCRTVSRKKNILFWEKLTTDSNDECLRQGLEPTHPADYDILPNCAQSEKPVPGSPLLKSPHRERGQGVFAAGNFCLVVMAVYHAGL